MPTLLERPMFETDPFDRYHPLNTQTGDIFQEILDSQRPDEVNDSWRGGAARRIMGETSTSPRDRYIAFITEAGYSSGYAAWATLVAMGASRMDIGIKEQLQQPARTDFSYRRRSWPIPSVLHAQPSSVPVTATPGASTSEYASLMPELHRPPGKLQRLGRAVVVAVAKASQLAPIFRV